MDPPTPEPRTEAHTRLAGLEGVCVSGVHIEDCDLGLCSMLGGSTRRARHVGISCISHDGCDDIQVVNGTDEDAGVGVEIYYSAASDCPNASASASAAPAADASTSADGADGDDDDDDDDDDASSEESSSYNDPLTRLMSNPDLSPPASPEEPPAIITSVLAHASQNTAVLMCRPLRPLPLTDLVLSQLPGDVRERISSFLPQPTMELHLTASRLELRPLPRRVPDSSSPVVDACAPEEC